MTSGQRKDGKYQTLEYIKVENEYYIVKYANCVDWYNVIILLMKDNWLLAISYKIFYEKSHIYSILLEVFYKCMAKCNIAGRENS